MKFMNMKRFASTVMAGALTLSLAAPAFAADSQTVITATYAETTLDVTVPANTAATINPYGLPVTMEDATTTLSGQPITISTPLMIENKSGVALKVGASIETTVGTGMTLETTKGSYDAETDKKLYVEFQAFEAAGIDGTTAADITKTNPAWAALKDADAALKVALDSTQAVDADPTGDDLVLREGKDGLAQAGGVAFVRLSGAVAKKAAWATTDKLVATITYSFEPAVYSKSAGTITGSVTVAASSTEDLTLNPSALPSGVTVAKWEWSSSDSSKATVSYKAGDTTGLKATVTHVAAGKSNITVSGVGSDGITYSTTIEVTLS